MLALRIIILLVLFHITFYAVSQNKAGVFKVKKQTKTKLESSDTILYPAYRQYQAILKDSCPCGGDINDFVISRVKSLSQLVKNCDWYNENIFFTSYEVYLAKPRSSIQIQKAHSDEFTRAVRLLLINTKGSKVTFSYIRAYNKKTGEGLKLPTVSFNPY